MRPITVSEIVRATGGTLVVGDPQAFADRGVSIDSRTAQPGSIYIAIRGEKFDGHQFLSECLSKGVGTFVISKIPADFNIALARLQGVIQVKDTRRALADLARYVRTQRGRGARVVGVSGSAGKTTVKEMIAQILSLAGSTLASPGNFNNEIGCPLALLELNEDHRFGVFEIGSSALGEVRRLAGIVQPHVAVVTNILLEHTETFGTIEQIAEGESEIFSALSEGGTAVLPRDDAHYEFLKSKVPAGCSVASFGFSDDATVRVADFSAWPAPTKFRLVRRDASGRTLDSIECSIPVIGRVNALNAAAAAAAVLSLGVDPEHIREALAQYRPPGLRFQTHRFQNGLTLVNDSYNANPGSMRGAIDGFVESYPDRRKILVLGDMLELGEISRKEHYELGKYIAQKPVDKIVLYGPQSKFTYEGARDSMMDESNLIYCSAADALDRSVESLLSSENVIFFKASRGMRLDTAVQNIIERNSVSR